MGYEIPGGLGAKMADPDREVYVFLGDGTYLMMPTEIVTSVQEGIKIIVVLVDNHGLPALGGLVESLGSKGFGTASPSPIRRSGQLDGELPPGGFCRERTQSWRAGAQGERPEEFRGSIEKAKALDRTTVIVIETDRDPHVPGYESWWDVAVPEISERTACAKREPVTKTRAKNNGTTCDNCGRRDEVHDGPRLENFMDGSLGASGASETLDGYQPGVRASIGGCSPFCREEVVSAAAAAAQKAFRGLAETPACERVQPLFRLKALLEDKSKGPGRGP